MSPTHVLGMLMPYWVAAAIVSSLFLMVIVVQFFLAVTLSQLAAAQLVQFVISKTNLFYLGVLLGELRSSFFLLLCALLSNAHVLRIHQAEKLGK